MLKYAAAPIDVRIGRLQAWRAGAIIGLTEAAVQRALQI